MRKINKKQRKSLVEAFNRKYGGINRIEKDGSIILCHGHTLWLDEQTEMRHRFTGKFRKLKDKSKYVEAIFSKRKYPTKIQNSGIYCKDMDEFLNHMKKVRKLVRKCGFKTYEFSLWGKIKGTIKHIFKDKY